MKAQSLIFRMKSYIQPFERRLALSELASVTKSLPRPVRVAAGEPIEFIASSRTDIRFLVNRLSYWESLTNHANHITEQVLREATTNVVRSGVDLGQIAKLVEFQANPPIPNRRCLRYGPHGIHEYRGKFFPQLVRALLNMAGVYSGGVVADPMSGSGTTVVEAVLSGCHGLGLDMNPLSAFMARTKASLLSVAPRDLNREYVLVREKLLKASHTPTKGSLPYYSSLPAHDQEYLARWFSTRILSDLDHIAMAITAVDKGPVQDLMWLALSNILRKVSWQKEDDLRVRKESKPEKDLQPIREFVEELGRSVRMLLAFLYRNRNQSTLGTFEICQGDARNVAQEWKNWVGRVDAVITSPPYATALPYLDTDRLSLVYLGKLSRQDHRSHDHQMIGNREIGNKQRMEFLEDFRANKEALPVSLVRLIEKIDSLNSKADVGFRRKNLSALLVKYFFDMKMVLRGVSQILKSRGTAYVVIGNNHTMAGGRRVEIDTAQLLVEIGSTVGLKAKEVIPMDMLTSRDIFRKNTVASESILAFVRN